MPRRTLRKKKGVAKKYLGSRKMRGGQAFLRRMFNRCFGGRCDATVGVDLNIPIKRGQDIHILDYINGILDQAIVVKGGPFKKGDLNDDAIQTFQYLRDHRIDAAESSEFKKFLNKHGAKLAGSALMYIQKQGMANVFFKSGDQNNNGSATPTLLDICKEAIAANFKRVSGEMKSSLTGVTQEEMDGYTGGIKARVDGEFSAPLPVALVPPPGYGRPPPPPANPWRKYHFEQTWGAPQEELSEYMGELGEKFNAEQQYPTTQLPLPVRRR